MPCWRSSAAIRSARCAGTSTATSGLSARAGRRSAMPRRGEMKRHVMLVGLPGVGKSTVGRLVAEGLDAPLLDIDSILVRQMGMPIAQIFGMVGETRFRAMERDAVNTAQAREPAVIVPGAGWAAEP